MQGFVVGQRSNKAAIDFGAGGERKHGQACLIGGQPAHVGVSKYIYWRNNASGTKARGRGHIDHAHELEESGAAGLNPQCHILVGGVGAGDADRFEHTAIGASSAKQLWAAKGVGVASIGGDADDLAGEVDPGGHAGKCSHRDAGVGNNACGGDSYSRADALSNQLHTNSGIAGVRDGNEGGPAGCGVGGVVTNKHGRALHTGDDIAAGKAHGGLVGSYAMRSNNVRNDQANALDGLGKRAGIGHSFG